MKMFVLLFAVVIVVATVGAYGGEKTTSMVRRTSKYTVLKILNRSQASTPNWVNGKDYKIVNDGNKKFIYVKIKAESPSKNKAKMLARVNRSLGLVLAIKSLATTEMSLACKKVSNSSEIIGDVESITSVLGKNIDVSGKIYRKTDEYWEKVKVKSKGKERILYRYFMQFKFPYSIYKQKMKIVWEKSIKKIVDPKKKKIMIKISDNFIIE